MSRTSIHHGATEPSFFYVLMAQSCFRRAVSTRHPNAGGALRQAGRDYLAKAGGTVPVLASQPSRSRRAQIY
jgi:hypothetical protein